MYRRIPSTWEDIETNRLNDEIPARKTTVSSWRKHNPWLGPHDFNHVIGYKNTFYRPDYPERGWIGRKLLYSGESPWWMEDKLVDGYISEDYIAKKKRPYVFRILYMKDSVVKSKANINYIPNRLNVFVDADTDRIIDLLYF
jgi:hypothetical protein